MDPGAGKAPCDDASSLRALVAEFFGAFATSPGLDDRMARLRTLFLPGARIVSMAGPSLASYDVDAFIEPRRALLSSGALTDFTEWPTAGRVEVFGDIARWFGRYAKRGVQDGVAFEGSGGKSIQFVRSSSGWLISAAAWDDDKV